MFCNHETDIPTLAERQLENGIIQVGILCTKCQYFTHAFYTNPNLQRQIQKIADSHPKSQLGHDTRKRMLTKYQEAFDKLQKEMEPA